MDECNRCFSERISGRYILIPNKGRPNVKLNTLLHLVQGVGRVYLKATLKPKMNMTNP